MPARIVIVNDDLKFLEEAAGAVRGAGHDVAAYADALEALDAIITHRSAELLVTRGRLGAQRLTGISLARVAKSKLPGLDVLLTVRQEFAEVARSIGEVLVLPVTVPEVVEAIDRILGRPSLR
jgi:DNA-binding NtrC family response regulator